MAELIEDVTSRPILLKKLKRIKTILGKNSLPDLRISTNDLIKLYSEYKDKIECVICYEDLVPRHTRLTCGHRFHTVCYDKYIRARCETNNAELTIIGYSNVTFMFMKDAMIPSCPMCRQFQFKHIPIIEFDNSMYMCCWMVDGIAPAIFTDFFNDIKTLKESNNKRGWVVELDGKPRVDKTKNNKLLSIDKLFELLDK